MMAQTTRKAGGAPVCKTLGEAQCSDMLICSLLSVAHNAFDMHPNLSALFLNKS